MTLPLFLLDAPGGGRLGLCPMPGRRGDLSGDIAAMQAEGVSLLLSMTERSEWAGDLMAATSAAGIGLAHLPIRDWGAPPEAIRAAWPEAARMAHRALDRGQTVLAHCFGGRGRSGMAVMRLMVERGALPHAALETIRTMRPGAVETQAQQSWASDVSIAIRDTSKEIDWYKVKRLLDHAFAYMDGVIDPPSSLKTMTAEILQKNAQQGWFWSASLPGCLAGCLFGSQQDDAFYISKLAVDPDMRGRGLGAQLIAAAEHYAAQTDHRLLRLDSRVELTRNHRFFKALGFVEIGRKSHPGFTSPTSICFEKAL